MARPRWALNSGELVAVLEVTSADHVYSVLQRESLLLFCTCGSVRQWPNKKRPEEQLWAINRNCGRGLEVMERDGNGQGFLLDDLIYPASVLYQLWVFLCFPGLFCSLKKRSTTSWQTNRKQPTPKSKSWRYNYMLAHVLVHMLTPMLTH